jgi:hypothetical protein
MSEVGNIFVINKILYQDDTTECERVSKTCKALYSSNKQFRKANNEMQTAGQSLYSEQFHKVEMVSQSDTGKEHCGRVKWNNCRVL